MSFRPILVLFVLLGLAPPANGQNFRPQDGRSQRNKTEPFAADGTVVAIAAGRVQIRTLSNQNWMVWIDTKAVIRVLGTAEADFLRPGMFLQFVADIDKKGKAKDPLTELTIFTPSEENPPGIWAEGTGPAGEDAPQQDTGPAAADDGGFGAATRDQNRRTAAAGTPQFSRYTVAGRITKARRGKLTINCVRGIVQIELAEQPEIKVDFADYSVVKPNDRVTVTKGKMFTGRMGIAQAQAITFELAEPLSLRKKRPSRKPPSRPRNKPGSAEQQPFGVGDAGQ